MLLALTDSVIVLGIMALIGLLGYLMDRRGNKDEHKENHAGFRP